MAELGTVAAVAAVPDGDAADVAVNDFFFGVVVVPGVRGGAAIGGGGTA